MMRRLNGERTAISLGKFPCNREAVAGRVGTNDVAACRIIGPECRPEANLTHRPVSLSSSIVQIPFEQ